MTKSKGGRGNKLPYSTTTVRIPEDIKPAVQKVVQKFEEGELDSCSTAKVVYFNENGEILIDEINFPLPAGYQHAISFSYVD